MVDSICLFRANLAIKRLWVGCAGLAARNHSERNNEDDREREPMIHERESCVADQADTSARTSAGESGDETKTFIKYVSNDTPNRKFPWKQNLIRILRLSISAMLVFPAKILYKRYIHPALLKLREGRHRSLTRPDFVFQHPYVTCSYYTTTKSTSSLEQMSALQVEPKKNLPPDSERGIHTRLAIVRPFYEFNSESLSSTFASWNSMVPCRAANQDFGDDTFYSREETDEWVWFDMSSNATGRQFSTDDEDYWECQVDFNNKSGFEDSRLVFPSDTFADSSDAPRAVDEVMSEFFSPGGWSRCFDNIYAIEANIPRELDLYIPAAQNELHSWVNGPNRQFEAAFRIIQSGEWGNYDGFYLMERESVPVKNYWLDILFGEIEAYKPFAVLGTQYDGDKWDSFYDELPISLLHHTNGNGIYNTSHPLLERLVGQLEVEASGPYNAIPYDYRMSQIWVEGTLGIVPKLAPYIMRDGEGEIMPLSDNTAMFTKWAKLWQDEEPYKFTKSIHNYAATNLIPRHVGSEYIIHGAKLYSPWDPARVQITLVISEWFNDRSLNLIKSLDSRNHPFERVIIMIPPTISIDHDYTKYTRVPVMLQLRDSPDFLDLCAAEVETEWFMITNSHYLVAMHVDLMFTPGDFLPVIPFTPATYPLCLKYTYCKEVLSLAQRWNPNHGQVIHDMDMLYNTRERHAFCEEWREQYGDSGEDLYSKHHPLKGKKIIGPKGPTASDYFAYLMRETKDRMYKLSDRSLYGSRSPFVKLFRKEERVIGMSEDELVRRMGMTMLNNVTDCSCDQFDTEMDCVGSELGCQWRPLFESCHPPEMIYDGEPICSITKAPTMSPLISVDRLLSESYANEDVTQYENKTLVHQENSLSLLASFLTSREHIPSKVGDVENEYKSLNGNRLMSALPIEDYGSEDYPGKNNSIPDLMLDEVSKLCPTWGPSKVPRRFPVNSPRDVLMNKREKNADSEWTSNMLKGLLPGHALHTEHQLVHFGSRIPFSHRQVELPSMDDRTTARLRVSYGGELKPLRITFDTSYLSNMLLKIGDDESTQSKITTYTDSIFPAVVNIWRDALMIKEPLVNIFPTSTYCGVSLMPREHLDDGIADADVVLYVITREKDQCSVNRSASINVCHFDQNMRPLIGSLSICLEGIELQRNSVSRNEILRHTATISKLVGKFLGMSPSLFQYFRNPNTDEPLGGRYIEISCGGDAVKELYLPTVINQRSASDGALYYEISTPTVTQVVRNHFDCQSMTGARLSPPQLNEDGTCEFSNLDLRYHFDEDMTSLSHNADAAFSISPLSLAILEDSSWYKANFTAATTPSFGRAAGCGFVHESCISKGVLPEYSEGYFCNTLDDLRSGCDFTHRNKAGCDLHRFAKPPPGFQYFLPESPDFGSVFDDVDYCPMRSKHLISCSSNTRTSSLLVGEFFDESSRCYDTNAGAPVCLETVCNPDDNSLSFVVEGKSFVCRYHGDVINTGFGYSVVCPRIAAVCPDLVCPVNCSGKGVCDYCDEVPKCICDDPFDDSPGCWNI